MSKQYVAGDVVLVLWGCLPTGPITSRETIARICSWTHSSGNIHQTYLMQCGVCFGRNSIRGDCDQPWPTVK